MSSEQRDLVAGQLSGNAAHLLAVVIAPGTLNCEEMDSAITVSLGEAVRSEKTCAA